MIKVLKRIFIKNYKNTEDSAVRLKYGFFAGIFGVISNFLLFAGKIIVGVLGSSITIIADAINNLSDMANNFIVIFGFKLSSKPADSEHPFGHARYEQIMALIVSVLIVSIGVLLLKSSIEKIISPNITTVSIATYIVLILSILIKLFQMLLYKDFGKSINSQVLKASSIDSRNDVISTFAVLIATILINVLGNIGFSIDGVFGLIVSMFIIYSSIKLVKETISPLLGEMPSKEFINNLKQEILKNKDILGVHDFLIHSYGPNTYYASAHAEVSSKADIMKIHDVIDNIESEFKQKYNIVLSIHMDPIDVNNEEVKFKKKKVEIILKNLNENIQFHDFRLVIGKTHTNVLFDVVIPFNCNLTLAQVKNALELQYKDEDKKYYFILGLDRV